MGSRTAYLGWLGKDPHGMLVYDSLIKEGIDVSHCRLIDGKNAYCEITLKDGDRIFGEFSEGVCNQINLNDDDYEFISTFDLVHTSTYSFILPFLKKLRSACKKISFDFSQEWNRKSLADILPFVDIALISTKNESKEYIDELLHFAYSYGPETVLITRGDQGAMLFDGNQIYQQLIISIEDVKDTLGAGDAFIARFLVDHLSGISIGEALENAARSAAEACSHHGAFGYGAPIWIEK
jgi:fructoselysine 6-kinase